MTRIGLPNGSRALLGRQCRTGLDWGGLKGQRVLNRQIKVFRMASIANDLVKLLRCELLNSEPVEPGKSKTNPTLDIRNSEAIRNNLRLVFFLKIFRASITHRYLQAIVSPIQ